MNKILVAINAADAQTNALDFACFIARLTSSTLSVLAVETVETENIPVVKRAHGMTYVASGEQGIESGVFEKYDDV